MFLLEPLLKNNFKNLDIKFNVVFTSELKRAQETAKIILQNLDQWDFLNNEGKIISNINLNERDYGDLTGLNKKETAEKFGEEQVHKWRRGYSDQPPNGESLEDVVRRVTKYFEEVINPAIQSNENDNILIAEEKGYNTYKKVAEKKCSLAFDWWKENSAKWSSVRAVWKKIYEKNL